MNKESIGNISTCNNKTKKMEMWKLSLYTLWVYIKKIGVFWERMRCLEYASSVFETGKEYFRFRVFFVFLWLFLFFWCHSRIMRLTLNISAKWFPLNYAFVAIPCVCIYPWPRLPKKKKKKAAFHFYSFYSKSQVFRNKSTYNKKAPN